MQRRQPEIFHRKCDPEYSDGCSVDGAPLALYLAFEQIQIPEDCTCRRVLARWIVRHSISLPPNNANHLSVIIVSIVRCVILVRIDLKSVDLNYNFAPLGVWTETEANIAILCGQCLSSVKHPVDVRQLICHSMPAFLPTLTVFYSHRLSSPDWTIRGCI